ncbi:hypothetical protein, partial [Microbacterium sp. H6]|uniref:hypothetical protein n=1 Tax=Microbacterium sp. H6 TaxID=421122 RepID=UPI001C68ADDA
DRGGDHRHNRKRKTGDTRPLPLALPGQSDNGEDERGDKQRPSDDPQERNDGERESEDGKDDRNEAVTALTEIPRFCSSKFPTLGR